MNEGKYRSVARLLKLRILRGIYKERLPSELQLARDLRVSTMTMEQALVQLETLGLIERRWRSGTFIIPREDRPKDLATMSVLLSEAVSDSIESEITYGFQRAAQAKGLHLILTTHPETEADKAVDEAVSYLKNLSCMGACVLAYPMDAARALRLSCVPGSAVIADCEAPDLVLPTINYDNREAGRLAAAHLLRLGHRSITLADPMVPSPERAVRIDAAAELVRQTGGAFRRFTEPDFTWGVPACVALLRTPEPSTGFICGGQSTAIDMATAARSLGLSVPGDISILSMGNINATRRSESFTSIHFDEAALGAGALDLLLEGEPGRDPRHVLVPVQLDDRDTTAPPGRKQETIAK